MVGRYKWSRLLYLSFVSVFGAWYSRNTALTITQLLTIKKKTMGTKVVDSSNVDNLPSITKNSMFNLFEILFNKKYESHIRFHIKHPDIVKRKLTRMIALGPHNLQIISDFDWCMSKYMNKGVMNATCHGIFESDPEMTNETRNKLRMLRQTYSSVEVDQHISVDMKIPYMLEWWDLSHKVIINSNIHRDALTTTVNKCDLVLRDKVINFMTVLHKHNIPMLIFSAGLGNVIELLLERFGICYDNVRVVSNFMDFNDEGLLIGFQEPIIHSFNKTVTSIANSDYNRNILSKRQNIILLGDSTADPNMAHGLFDENENKLENDENGLHQCNILKIGFLNTKVDSLLEKYKNLYDIVLFGDGTFDLPLDVVNCILHSNSLDS